MAKSIFTGPLPPRLTGADEVGTHEALRTGLEILTKSIEGHGGLVDHYAGDAVLAEFGSGRTPWIKRLVNLGTLPVR